ncbi:cyclase dehydrase [Methylobacterium sp. 17Sr1-1]|uniref:cyclase dehydrase n=1 Tax=Methylobacterium sp. 17Sr1-1 TaxID=2202826 RepID=UPI001FE0316B|nr:cyclase dehydrase [Methylobacterium sp. 17Sr1-1]
MSNRAMKRTVDPRSRSAHDALARGLGWFSIGLGLAEILAPRALCRALGLEGREALIQAYGAREVATGAAILMSHDPTPWIWGRVAGDALDLATLATGFEGDNPRAGTLALATAAVAGVTLADIVCVQGLTADKRPAPRGSYEYHNRSGFPRGLAAAHGAARDFAVPRDFRIPGPLRPWRDGRPAA